MKKKIIYSLIIIVCIGILFGLIKWQDKENKLILVSNGCPEINDFYDKYYDFNFNYLYSYFKEEDESFLTDLSEEKLNNFVNDLEKEGLDIVALWVKNGRNFYSSFGDEGYLAPHILLKINSEENEIQSFIQKKKEQKINEHIIRFGDSQRKPIIVNILEPACFTCNTPEEGFGLCNIREKEWFKGYIQKKSFFNIF